MADQAQAPTINAAFPAPPPFWKHFTQDNISRLEAIVSPDSSTDNATQRSNKVKTLKASELRALEVPQELDYLIPPAPPSGDTYTVFNDTINLTSIPPFPEGQTQLYPDPPPSNPAPHLLLVTKSVLLNFLELCSTLSIDPAHANDKLDDIETLLLNAHQLINLYRPHQARETLIGMLEDRVEGAKKEIEEMTRWEEDVKGWLGNTQGTDMPQQGESSMNGSAKDGKSEKDRQKEEETKRLWKMIHAIDFQEDGEEVG